LFISDFSEKRYAADGAKPANIITEFYTFTHLSLTVQHNQMENTLEVLYLDYCSIGNNINLHLD
jgi:hypothetical protein